MSITKAKWMCGTVMVAVLAGLILVSKVAQAETDRRPVAKVTTKCEDGYQYKVFQTITQMNVVQVIGQDGKPATCGERLKAIKAKEALQVEFWRAMLKEQDRMYEALIGKE